MNDSTVIDFPRPDVGNDPLSELIRSGARQLILNAVELELQELLAATAERREGVHYSVSAAIKG